MNFLLYLEDCRETINKLYPNSVDCVFTSPPYFAGKEYEDKEKTKIGYDKYIFKDWKIWNQFRTQSRLLFIGFG